MTIKLYDNHVNFLGGKLILNKNLCYKFKIYLLYYLFSMSSLTVYLQKKLNDEQYAAATYTSDHALILAGA